MAERKEVNAEAYARLFQDAQDGPDVIDDLKRKFAFSAVTKGGIDGILETYQRDGARRVIEYILSRIKQANEG